MLYIIICQLDIGNVVLISYSTFEYPDEGSPDCRASEDAVREWVQLVAYQIRQAKGLCYRDA